MPSPISKKNLLFIAFAVFAVVLVTLLLVFRPFQSSFGEAPVQNSMSAPITLAASQIKSFKQDTNPFRSPSVADATGELDKLIEETKIEIKNLDPNMLSGINNDTINNLYSQLKQTLADALTFRNNIMMSTPVDSIIMKSAALSNILNLFVSKVKSLVVPS